jgi:hypothetical protein
LVKRIAGLAFKNKDYLLFFRGQRNDHENRAGNSSFYPSIYRTNKENLSKELLEIRFEILEQASKLLINKLENNKDIDGSIKELKNRKYIRWSILQHYEVCDTPLLDLTQSIRVACSFALLKNNKKGFLYIFGLPYITNRISINSEHDIVNIRLINICPPLALRPYFQEGFLVGTDDITINYDERTDLDFKHRLIAKFELDNTENKFWTKHDSLEKYLKPSDDKFEGITIDIKQKINEANNIEMMFPGQWLNKYVFKDGRSSEEIFEIKNGNEYHALGKHLFNLDFISIDLENKILKFRKNGIGNDSRKAVNNLRIIDKNRYEGIETSGTKISYTRIK